MSVNVKDKEWMLRKRITKDYRHPKYKLSTRIPRSQQTQPEGKGERN